MTHTFGSKESVALVVGSPAWPIREVEVWVAGQNLSVQDSSAHLPSFVASMASTQAGFQAQLNFLQHENHFFGLGVEEAFSKVVSQALPDMWAALRVLDWGPTTDEWLCFLLPIHGKLYLACRQGSSKTVKAVQILPCELMHTLGSAIAELSNGPGVSLAPSSYPTVASFSNGTSSDLHLYLEMVPEEVILSPGHTIDLLARPSKDLLPLTIDPVDGGLQIYACREFDPDWHVRFNGKVIKADHPTRLKAFE